MPVCEQGSLEVPPTTIQLLPSNAVDHEVSSSLELNDLHDFEFNPLYFPYEQPGEGNPELNTIDLELPNLDSLFEGLDLAMEEFWVENNRSLSLLSLYVNNVTQPLTQMGQPTKPLEAKKPVLKLSKVRCAGKECSICFSGIKKSEPYP